MLFHEVTTMNLPPPNRLAPVAVPTSNGTKATCSTLSDEMPPADGPALAPGTAAVSASGSAKNRAASFFTSASLNVGSWTTDSPSVPLSLQGRRIALNALLAPPRCGEGALTTHRHPECKAHGRCRCYEARDGGMAGSRRL